LHVIPVIDLKCGTVVRAVGGDRANYQPIDTPLAPGSHDPVDVVAGLLAFCAGFDRLYVADLDGIEGRGRDLETIRRISETFPRLRLLVDDGSATVSDVAEFANCPSVTPVIGSETLGSLADLAGITDRLRGGFALSLDWRGTHRLGPDALFEDATFWPVTLIVMTLDRVGRREGPALDRLKSVKDIAGDREVLAAGGVRDINDLWLLHRQGCGALIASCLHDGALSRGDLAALLEDQRLGS
jgi:HisA/HisF family protein